MAQTKSLFTYWTVRTERVNPIECFHTPGMIAFLDHMPSWCTGRSEVAGDLLHPFCPSATHWFVPALAIGTYQLLITLMGSVQKHSIDQPTLSCAFLIAKIVNGLSHPELVQIVASITSHIVHVYKVGLRIEWVPYGKNSNINWKFRVGWWLYQNTWTVFMFYLSWYRLLKTVSGGHKPLK